MRKEVKHSIFVLVDIFNIYFLEYTVDHDFHLLMLNINSPKVVNTYEHFKIPPAIGEIVLVKHWSSQWVRGVVREFSRDEIDEPSDFQVCQI